MAIGKSSIEKRVAKTTEETVATAEVVTEAKAPTAKKPATKSSSTAKKSTTTAAKKPAAKPAAKKPAAPKVDTGVLANVSPETVEKVTGHKENAKVEIVQVGGKMPTHLL